MVAAIGMIVAVAVLLAFRARSSKPSKRRAFGFISLSLLLIFIAIAGPRWLRSSTPSITVLIDTSASTRVAAFRDPAALLRRIRQLLPQSEKSSIDYCLFADQNHGITSLVSDGHTRLPDLSSEKTNFDTAGIVGDAIILFSDGQFDSPQPIDSPPVYPVIDPGLEQIVDARITRLDVEGQQLVVAAANSGQSMRDLTLSADSKVSFHLGVGSIVERLDIHRAGMPAIKAQLDAGDEWPENDALTVDAPPPATDAAERWWVGRRSSAASRTFASGDKLPINISEYLAASIIVLDDQPIESIPPAVQQQLLRYVRDLGGTLVILGGEHSFGAGGYVGSLIDSTLSPLASASPTPRRQWIILLDASGSMDQSMVDIRTGQAETKWALAVHALHEQLGGFPPNDLIRIASFSRDVRWWVQSQPINEILGGSFLAPADVRPSGPTNLGLALQSIVQTHRGTLPRSLLVITDGDADLPNATALRTAFLNEGIALSLLSTRSLAANSPLSTLSAATGGSSIAIADETQASFWSSALQKIARAADTTTLLRSPRTAHFNAPLKLPARAIAPINRVWTKTTAHLLARDDDDHPLSADQQVGLGRVVAVAFEPSSAELAAFLGTFHATTSDPRFTASWQDDGSAVHLTLEAVDVDRSMNGLHPRLCLDAKPSIDIPQTAPGQYQITFDRASDSTTAVVELAGRVIARTAFASHYPVEFSRLGNNRVTLQALADRTGGRVIEPDDHSRIRIGTKLHGISLVPFVAMAAAFTLALAIVCLVRQS